MGKLAALAAAEAHYHQLHTDNHEHLEGNKDKLVSSLAGLHDAIEDAKKTATTDRAALKKKLANSSAGMIQALKQKAAEKQEQQRSAGMQKNAAEVLGHPRRPSRRRSRRHCPSSSPPPAR